MVKFAVVDLLYKKVNAYTVNLEGVFKQATYRCLLRIC